MELERRQSDRRRERRLLKRLRKKMRDAEALPRSKKGGIQAVRMKLWVLLVLLFGFSALLAYLVWL